jgi:hypothetical protein
MNKPRLSRFAASVLSAFSLKGCQVAAQKSSDDQSDKGRSSARFYQCTAIKDKGIFLELSFDRESLKVEDQHEISSRDPAECSFNEKDSSLFECSISWSLDAKSKTFPKAVVKGSRNNDGFPEKVEFSSNALKKWVPLNCE